MITPLKKKHFYEFGLFRLDASIPVLMRNGDIVALTPKALDTLLVLLQNNGNVVDKETLIQAVWPGAFVEESNLAQHISALRKALGDGAGAAIYIETVPKRGYRLTGKVLEVGKEDTRPSLPDVAAPPEPGTAVARHRGFVLAGIVAVGLVVIGLALWLNRPSSGAAPQWKHRQLTANTEQNPVLRSAISPDGKYLAYSDLAGIHVLVVETGENRLINSPDKLCFR